jgi:regulator of protease activity HflC (stomatin/prohibitin superfamily)
MNELSQVPVDLSTVRFWVWVVAWALALAFLYFGRRPGRLFAFRRVSIASALVVLIVAAVVPAGLGRVQAGARGVVLRFGAPTGRVAGEGLYYVVPLVERVVQVNTQINTIRFDRAQATCHDLEPVYADLAVSFHVDPSHAIDIYSLLRNNYAQRIVYPAVQDAWKATVANYTAPDLVDQRSAVQHDFEDGVRTRLAKFGLSLDAVATTRFNFSYAYAQAAQQKVASVQRTLQAKQDLQRIRFESQQSVIRARSEVEALKLQRNIPVAELIRLRQIDLQRRAIDKWDGHLPTTTGGLPFLGSTLAPHQD